MKSHKEIEIIDTAIFSSTSGFAPGELTSIFCFVFCFVFCFFHKGPRGNEKGELKSSLPKLPKNFRLGCVLATAEKMIGSEQTFLNPFVYSFSNVVRKPVRRDRITIWVILIKNNLFYHKVTTVNVHGVFITFYSKRVAISPFFD